VLLTATPFGDFAIVCLLAVIGAHVALLHSQRRWLLFDPLNMFWAGYLVVYVLQPIKYGDVFIVWYSSEVFDQTLFWTVCAAVAVIVGYESGLGQSAGRWLPRLPERLCPARTGLAAIALLAVGLLGYGELVASAGTLGTWLSVARGGTDWEAISGYVAVLADLLPIGVLVLLFHAELHRPAPLWRCASWALGVLLLLWFIYLGSRSRTIATLLLLLMAWHLPRRRNPPVILCAAAFLGLLLLVNFQTQYRENFTNLSLNLEDLDSADAWQEIAPTWLGGDPTRQIRLVSRGIDFSATMAVVALVPQQVDYNYGYALLEFVTRPIPRALWAEKRYPYYEAVTPIMQSAGLSSHWVRYGAQPVLTGPAFTFVGHWYAVGGPLALMIAGLATGAFFRMLRILLDRQPWSEGGMIFYSTLPMLGFLEAAATPLFWIFTYPFLWAGLLVVLQLARGSSRVSFAVGLRRRQRPSGTAESRGAG
jgi:hypothetical protein